jgi:hypothetical protein
MSVGVDPGDGIVIEKLWIDVRCFCSSCATSQKERGGTDLESIKGAVDGSLWELRMWWHLIKLPGGLSMSLLLNLTRMSVVPPVVPSLLQSLSPCWMEMQRKKHCLCS